MSITGAMQMAAKVAELEARVRRLEEAAAAADRSRLPHPGPLPLKGARGKKAD